MSLAERVAPKGFELSKYLLGHCLWNSLRRCAIQEFLPEQLDLLTSALVAQCAPQKLALAGRETRCTLRDFQDLFLKQNHAQSLLQRRFQQRVVISNVTVE